MTSRTLSRMIMLACLGGMMLISLGGCSTALQEERDALWRQNTELQDRNAQLLAHNQALQREKEALLSQNGKLMAENAALKAKASQPVVKYVEPKRDTSRDTGFEGIGGIESVKGRGTVTVKIPGSVLFRSGKADLTTTSRATLKQIADVLTGKYRGKSIRVEGHTDSDPIRKSKWRDNYQLSEARAASVRDYLATQGVSTSSMTIRGFGADKPVASNSSVSGKAQNRRVEIVVLTD